MAVFSRAAVHTALTLSLAIAVTITGSVTLGQSSQVTEPGPTALADYEVFGFLPYWELARADSIDLEVLTTLAWFGVEAGRDGRLLRETADGVPTPGWEGWTSQTFVQLRERAQAADVRVVLTVERFSWDKAGKRTTKSLLADPDARATLRQEIVDAVTTADADGVNLDFEPLPQQSREGFVHLVRGLRRALDAVDPSLQLTFDLTPDVESYPLSRLVAEGAADAAVLMGYEYRTSASSVAGSVAPLRDPGGLDVRESVKRARARAPDDHIILALPWYGRAWSTKTDEPGSKTRRSDQYIQPSTALYRVSVPRAASAGRHYDQTQGSAWSAYRSRACETCPESWRQLWYDDVDSVLAKLGLARRKDLRGVGIWALGYEGVRPDLWSALRYGLERRKDHVPPAGSASIAPESTVDEQDGLPTVGSIAVLDLAAWDGDDGSGVAFVRVGTRRRLGDDGSLKHGTTFPAVDSVAITMPDAAPVDGVFIPGAAVPASAELEPSPEPSPMATSEPVSVTIRVQWRDIAGNWSEPINVPALVEAKP